MGEAIGPVQEPEAGAKVLDLHDVRLDRVFERGDTALANSIRDALDNIRRPRESWSAHGSTP